MTRKELADLIGISRPTLNQWEKDKPELVRLINQGLTLDSQIIEAEENLQNCEIYKKNLKVENFN